MGKGFDKKLCCIASGKWIVSGLLASFEGFQSGDSQESNKYLLFSSDIVYSESKMEGEKAEGVVFLFLFFGVP